MGKIQSTEKMKRAKKEENSVMNGKAQENDEKGVEKKNESKNVDVNYFTVVILDVHAKRNPICFLFADGAYTGAPTFFRICR